MYKLKLLLLPVAWLLAFMAFACAPPDDDDRSSAPSGPTINNAIYDFATALLTVQGTDLSPTSVKQAQIQTIRVGSRTNGVALSSYTADDPATGVNSNGLAKGKYRIKSDGTALWLKLTDDDKATLEAKVGSDGLKKGLLTSSGAWAGLNTPKDLDVSNVPENKQSKVSDDNQPSKQTEEAEQDEQAEQVEQAEEESRKLPEAEQAEEESRKLPEAEQAEEESRKLPEAEQAEEESRKLPEAEQAEEESRKLPEAEQAEEESRKLPEAEQAEEESRKLPEAEQAEEESRKLPEAEQAEEESRKLPEAEETEQQSPKQTEQAEQAEQAAITSATYNVNTGKLVITGTNLPKTVAEWDFIKLTLVSGDGSDRFTLPRHSLDKNSARGFAASTTSLTITLKGSVKAEAEKILVKVGDSDNNGAYNLEAAAGFVIGSAEDTSNNPITVSEYAASITRATYDANTGKLQIQGRNLPRAVADWDFSKLTLVSGDGRNRYPLPRHSTAGENTATGSSANVTGLLITLSGTEKAKANAILVKSGGSDNNGAYNLEAAAGFAGGSAEDTSNNPITVSGYVILLKTVSYISHRSLLHISGSRLPTAVADWDFSKLTLVSGDGKKRYTLPRHSTTGANKATGSRASRTSLNITLSGIVKAKVEAILVKVGDSDNNGAYNLEAAAEFVPGSPEDLTTSIYKL